MVKQKHFVLCAFKKVIQQHYVKSITHVKKVAENITYQFAHLLAIHHFHLPETQWCGQYKSARWYTSDS